MQTLQFKWLSHGEGLKMPSYETRDSSGMDIAAAIPEDEPVTIEPGQRHMFPTGFALAIPQGYEAQIRSRSGMTFKRGLVVAAGIGTIDADYRGELKVVLQNISDEPQTITRGTRIAQMVIAPVVQPTIEIVEELDDTDRGTGGFGSTGTDG